MTVAQYARNIKALRSEIFNIIVESIEETLNEAIELNKSQLFENSMDRKGKKLRQYRSKDYARKKNMMNPLPGLGSPDLFDTGKFFDSFDAQIVGQSVLFYATDSKTGSLIEKYGSDIFGLTNEAKGYYRETLMPIIIKKINDKLKN